MKQKRSIPAITLTLLVTSLIALHNGFTGTSYSSQANAQSNKAQQKELKVAEDEFDIALDNLGLNIPEATALFNQGKKEQGLEIYKQELERQGQIASSSDYPTSEVEEVSFALAKLAVLSDRLDFLNLADSALSSAAEILRRKTDDLAIFEFSKTHRGGTVKRNTSDSNSVWSNSWTPAQTDERTSVSFMKDIGDYVPHFSLLQQIFAAKGRLILRQQGSSVAEQEQYYQSLLSSEVVRTLSVDESIANQLNTESPDFTKLVRAFSTRITAEDLKKVAKTEGATIVSYSILSEQDNISLLARKALYNEAVKKGFKPKPFKRLSLPDRLLIWVVKPTGEIKLVESKIPFDLGRNVAGSMNFPGACERSATSDECRGQSGTAIAQLVRFTRSAIGVKVRGQQGTAIARLVRNGLPDSISQKNSALSEQLNKQNEALKQLYTLLIKPIEKNLPLNEQSRIVFIPQGSLSFVPFAALKDSTDKYLIEKHTIQTAPNFRTLLFANLNREQWSSDNKGILIVGNPTMPQLQGVPSALQLENLPNAKKEAETVSELFKRKGYQPNLLTEGRATEVEVSDQMRKARIIHLATHGILDAESETADRAAQKDSSWIDIRMSGWLPVSPTGALALSSSGNGENENGFLTAAELFQMRLKADLVTLSACNTGRGPLTPGGVIGLPFSLSIAGVPSTVVSLWAVPDDSTAQLMTKFYESYLANPKDKAQALRQAMLYMLKNGYRDSPLDWAAFTLVGTSH